MMTQTNRLNRREIDQLDLFRSAPPALQVSPGGCYPVADHPDINKPSQVEQFWRETVWTQSWAMPDREQVLVLCLNTKWKLVGYGIVSIGTLDSSSIHARDIFRIALSFNAYGIILTHNHPSGDVTPSAPDHVITRRMTQAGELLDIRLLDHVIVGDPGTSYSFRENGQL